MFGLLALFYVLWKVMHVLREVVGTSENTEGAIKMDNPENTEGAIKLNNPETFCFL